MRCGVRIPRLRFLIASALAVAVPSACDDSTIVPSGDGGSIADDGGTTFDVESAGCPPDGEKRYSSFTLAPGVDGIEFRSVSSSGTLITDRRAFLGKVCGKASNESGCLAKVAATPSNVGWETGMYFDGKRVEPRFDYGVVTRGDEVTLVTTLDAFIKTVSPINEARAAVALALLANVDGAVCESNNVQKVPGGYRVRGRVRGRCGETSTDVYYLVTPDGKISEDGRATVDGGRGPCAVDGRRPIGLVLVATPWLESLGAHFSEIAFMEAAAVIAFDQIIERLRGFDAPASVIERAQRAREDEVRHAQATARFARRFGGDVRAPDVVATKAPSLFEFALENAIEGCVRETYGALVAAHQAAHAEDIEVRRAFATLAREEIEHAELSWALAAWVEAKLTPSERQRVSDARACAIVELAREFAVEPSEEVRRFAGMPSAATVEKLIAAMTPELLGAA